MDYIKQVKSHTEAFAGAEALASQLLEAESSAPLETVRDIQAALQTAVLDLYWEAMKKLTMVENKHDAVNAILRLNPLLDAAVDALYVDLIGEQT